MDCFQNPHGQRISRGAWAGPFGSQQDRDTPARPHRAMRLSSERTNPPKGRGECRVPAAPAVSRAKILEHTSVVTARTTGFTRHSRTRMVLTVSFVVSLVSRAFLPPSSARCASIAADLIPASGYQDATTSPSAFVPFVVPEPKRPPHPAPNVRDDRETPLMWGRDGEKYAGDLLNRSTTRPAANWHDGQITCRTQNVVNRNFLLARMRPGAPTRENTNDAARSRIGV